MPAQPPPPACVHMVPPHAASQLQREFDAERARTGRELGEARDAARAAELRAQDLAARLSNSEQQKAQVCDPGIFSRLGQPRA